MDFLHSIVEQYDFSWVTRKRREIYWSGNMMVNWGVHMFLYAFIQGTLVFAWSLNPGTPSLHYECVFFRSSGSFDMLRRNKNQNHYVFSFASHSLRFLRTIQRTLNKYFSTKIILNFAATSLIICDCGSRYEAPWGQLLFCVEFARSPHVCMGSLQVVWLPPRVQKTCIWPSLCIALWWASDLWLPPLEGEAVQNKWIDVLLKQREREGVYLNVWSS